MGFIKDRKEKKELPAKQLYEQKVDITNVPTYYLDLSGPQYQKKSKKSFRIGSRKAKNTKSSEF